MRREKLIAKRKELGFTQAQIADLIGVKRASYTRFETGIRTPNIPVAIKISDILEGTVKDFF